MLADLGDGEVAFLRTVREDPTDRSEGIHVAALVGVPEPVGDRSRSGLRRLRAEKAIEARGSDSGGAVQAVFDLAAGGFRMKPLGDGKGEVGEAPEREAVLAERAALAVEEMPSVDVLAGIQAWQDQLDDE